MIDSSDNQSLKGLAKTVFHSLKDLYTSTLNEGKRISGNWSNKNFNVLWNPQMSEEVFIDNLIAQLTRVNHPSTASKQGHVFCYHCNRYDCEHAFPQEKGHIFAGYQDTGRPFWNEFFNYLIALNDTRIDTLFSNSNTILAKVVTRKVLIENQLQTF